MPIKHMCVSRRSSRARSSSSACLPNNLSSSSECVNDVQSCKDRPTTGPAPLKGSPGSALPCAALLLLLRASLTDLASYKRVASLWTESERVESSCEEVCAWSLSECALWIAIRPTFLSAPLAARVSRLRSSLQSQAESLESRRESSRVAPIKTVAPVSAHHFF